MVLVIGDFALHPDILHPGIVEQPPYDCRELRYVQGRLFPAAGSSGVLNQSINSY